VKEELDWLYNNPNETKDVYDKRLEEVSKKLTPILQKSGGGESSGGSGNPFPEGFNPENFTKASPTPKSSDSNVKIEEVD
jgi:hypothetical protein